jgi:GT2 family glycosyltransferase
MTENQRPRNAAFQGLGCNFSAPKVAIVVLNWNNYRDTMECLLSLQEVRYSPLDIIIVDNGSQDDSGVRLKGEFRRHTFLFTRANLGFTGGNNLGIRYALEHGAENVLLLNNDTVVSPNFLDILVAYGKTDSTAGISGPKIYYYNEPQRIWSTGGYFKKLKGSMSTLGFNKIDRGEYTNAAEADFISGCAIMIRKDVFQTIGFLDETFFHYAEEADFCLRAKEYGFKVVFVPDSVIWHKVSRTFGGGLSPKYLYVRSRNRLLLVYKHFGRIYLTYCIVFHFIVFIPFKIINLLRMRKKILSGSWALVLGTLDFLAYMVSKRFYFSRKYIS